MKKKLKVAVLGLGIGKSHLIDYKNNRNVSEICICARTNKTLSSVGDEFNIQKRYNDFDQLLCKEKPDAVSITTHNDTHFDFALKALKSGSNVLLEKPFALNTKQAIVLQKTAKKYNKTLMINYNLRYSDAVYSLKKIIDNNELGRINHIKLQFMRKRGIPWWFPLEDGKAHIGGGPFIDIGVHYIDVAMFLSDNFSPDYISANATFGIGANLAKNHNIVNYNVEDMGVAFISLKNGPTISIETSWAYNGDKDISSITVFGQDKTAEISNDGNFIFESNGESVNQKQLNIAHSEKNIRDAFIDCILKKAPPQCTPLQGVAMMKIIDGFYNSIKKQKPIKIK